MEASKKRDEKDYAEKKREYSEKLAEIKTFKKEHPQNEENSI